MAQILTWDIDYTAAEEPWSVVRCESRKTIEDYLTPRSIILLHADRFCDEQLFFMLIRMRLPQTAIAVVGSDTEIPEIIDRIEESAIEEYIRTKMIREVVIDDPRKEIAIAEGFLKERDATDLLLVFDMDGTVVRSDGFTYEAMRMGFEQMYREEGIKRPVPSYEELIPATRPG